MIRNVCLVTLGLLLSLAMVACTDSGKNEDTSTGAVTASGSAATGGSAPVRTARAWGNAPDIEYTTFSGEKKKLSDHAGRPLVVNFWAAWCGPCVAEMPEFNKVYKESGGSFDLVAIAVDQRNDPTTFFAAKQFAFVGAFSETGFLKYIENSIPVTAFIDRNGDLVHKQTGGMSIEVFRENLSKIL